MKQSANALLESGANRNRRMKMKQMKTYIIIAGVNGTGKSALSGERICGALVTIYFFIVPYFYSA